MRNILISFFILSSLLSDKTLAQSPLTTMTAEVSIKVNGAITLAKVRDLNMGFVVQGVTSENVDPIASGSQSAFFTLLADPNSSVAVSFSWSNLTNGSDDITFTGTLAGNNSSSQNNATLIKNGNTITTNLKGGYFFWAGGTAYLSPTQPLGTYSGDFTLSIAY